MKLVSVWIFVEVKGNTSSLILVVSGGVLVHVSHSDGIFTLCICMLYVH